MFKYVVNRIISAIITMFILSVLIFSIIHLTPGDPARIMLGADASVEQVEQLNESLGLNEPLLKQYWSWVTGIFHGDLGTSYSRNGTVVEEITKSMGPTITLSAWALLLIIVIAIPLGMLAAKKKGKVVDSAVVGFSLLGISVPSFLLSVLCVMFFSVKLKIFPVAGYKTIEQVGFVEHIRYITLPVISLALMQVAMLTRMTRASLIDVINNDYIKAAKSKGLSQRVILYKHALRNALIPILTTIGQIFATLLSGAAVVETVFNVSGIGQLIVNSVQKRDYPIIQGIVIVISLIYIVINFSIDILYGIVDPRIRVAKKA